MGEFVDKLVKYQACFPAVEWVTANADTSIDQAMETVLSQCTDPSWIYWLIQRASLDISSFREELIEMTVLADDKLVETLKRPPSHVTTLSHSFVDRGEMDVVLSLAGMSVSMRLDLLALMKKHFSVSAIAEGIKRLP